VGDVVSLLNCLLVKGLNEQKNILNSQMSLSPPWWQTDWCFGKELHSKVAQVKPYLWLHVMYHADPYTMVLPSHTFIVVATCLAKSRSETDLASRDLIG